MRRQKQPPAGLLDTTEGRWPGKGAARPHAPRGSARAYYRLHRVLERNPAWEALASFLESHPRIYEAFDATEEWSKRELFGCRMCGQCALPLTGYACPMTCPKQLRNGPCGGVRPDGGCEVYPERRCVWVLAYERASEAGHLQDLSLLHRPIDQRRQGESSWVNFWPSPWPAPSLRSAPAPKR
jgi:hypothetical protein